MLIADIIRELENVAPSALQEDYDNSGLIIGQPATKVSNALVSLDCTEAIVDEALMKNCNLIISHHPILFRGIKRLNGNTYVERTLIKALKNDIAIYAIHTNLDNVLNKGVNSKIAEKLGLLNTKILEPHHGKLLKLVTYVPERNADEVREALFKAGAGKIGHYDSCSFNSIGLGTFRANENANPYVGDRGVLHNEKEIRIETILPFYLKSAVIAALNHVNPYEEVAYDIYQLINMTNDTGSGIIGELKEAISSNDFLKLLKIALNVEVIKYTSFHKPIKTIALCGGSGSFLLNKAIRSGADAFITSDFKYHEFFDAENKLMVCDVGHYESEQFTPELIIEIIKKNYPKFAPILAETNTNPVNYYH